MTRTATNRLGILLQPITIAIVTWMLVYYVMPKLKAVYADTGTELNGLTQFVFRAPPAILFAGGILIGCVLSLGRAKNDWRHLVPIGTIAYLVYMGIIVFAIFGSYWLSK